MPPTNISPRDRLIVALDLPGAAAAEAMVGRLGDSVTVLQNRLSARLCRRTAADAPPRRQRQEGVRRSQAARHRQHGGPRRRKHCHARRGVLDRACLSTDHEGRGRGGSGIGAQDPRRHRADLLRRPRCSRCRLSLRRLRIGRGPRATGAGTRRRRPRLLAGGGGRLAQDRRASDQPRDSRHSPGRRCQW